MAKRRMICATCGSSDVVVDAWASWDIPSQQWELKDIFDDAMCLTCERACSIDEPELTPEEAADYDTTPLRHIGDFDGDRT